ncbi:MAG: hypothetical protein GF417_11295 [Candidatus Latescibacteria bacterium]|nr:hypothetical protein [bacterium]MBD3425011.1 hypothetical protein [Candidatus Latescibacterota bacterium]
MIKRVAIIIAAAGILLLSLDIAGLVVRPGFTEDAAEGPSGIPGYHYALNDGERLRELLGGPVDQFDLNEANRVLFGSIVHGAGRRLTPYENWILYLIGLIYPPAGKTQDPERIAAGGVGLCSEVAAVLIRIARINGMSGRFIVLGGHTVAEIDTGEGWRVADPDYGVAYELGLSELEGEKGVSMIRNALKGGGYPDSVIEKYTGYFQSSNNNMVLEEGEVPSPGLYRLERSAELLKWIIPALLIISGAFMAGRKR